MSLFNKTSKNILSNYIPHEIITIDDRNPPWFNKNVKSLIDEKNKAWRLYVPSNKNDWFFFEKFTSLRIPLNDLKETRKQNYHFCLTEKLRDRKTSLKAYGSLLKTFLNNKKILCILPIFYENDFVIDFQKKAEIFNEFFAKQRTVVQNSSKLPSVFIRKTDKSLSTVTFYENEIKKAIHNLDPSKVNGYLHVKNLWWLGLIFQSCFENGKFPSEWKKANVAPTYKKNDKQLVKNYGPVSLLPICGKVFEHLNHLTMDMKWVESFSIFLKHLVRYGTKVLYIN